MKDNIGEGTICKTCGEELGEAVVEYEHVGPKDSHYHTVTHIKAPEPVKPVKK